MAADMGYYEDPPNGDGIVRARTTKQIRSWEFDRSARRLEVLHAEFGGIQFPCVYVLRDRRKVYIGEAKDTCGRLKTHTNDPEPKISGWSRALIVNDGRPASQSDFNDGVVRKALESYLIKLFKANRYEVVAQGESQNLNPLQKALVTSLQAELDFLLSKKNLVTRFLDLPGEDEVHRDQLKKVLERAGKKVAEWTAYQVVVDGQTAFIRSGSKKPKGWQITFRDVFKDALQQGRGALLVPRGPVLLIPMEVIREAVGAESEYHKNTIDVFVHFADESITLSYKKTVVDVTAWKLG